MKHFLKIILLALCVGSAFAQDDDARESQAAAALEDDDFIDRSPKDCLRLNRIRRTRVIDNQTIAFYGRGGEVYVNNLPRNCPGLSTEDRFSYEVRSNQLCEIDFITVLQRFGTQFVDGFTCRLGQFYPTNEDAIEMMIAAAENTTVTSPVIAEPVELPDEFEDAEEADSE